MLNRKMMTLVGAALAAAAPTEAAVQIVSSGGELLGATGVTIAGRNYDVQFLDGTCGTVFGTCNNPSFTFTNDDTAKLAARALLDQVFLNTTLGAFDDDVTLAAGCSFRYSCVAHIPYGVSTSPVFTIRAVNYVTENNDVILNGLVPTDYDLGTNIGQVWAKFSLSSGNVDPNPPTEGPETPAVPEPVSWSMMVIGFGALGAALRRRSERGAVSLGLTRL